MSEIPGRPVYINNVNTSEIEQAPEGILNILRDAAKLFIYRNMSKNKFSL